MSDSKSRFTNGVIWNFFDSISSQLISFVVSVILARVLLPSHFGLIAIVFVVISIAQVFFSGSLNEALIIQNKNSTLSYNSTFYYNIFSSVLLYIIIFILSPFIAFFFEVQELEIIIKVLSITVVIGASNVVHIAILNMNLDFRKMFLLKIPGIVISSTAGVLLAYNGFGIYSLVYQNLLLNIINSVMIWGSNIWYPKLEFSILELKKLFKYGGKMLIANIINKIFESIYPVIIGKIYSSKILGYYNRGTSIKDLLINNLVQTIARVGFPVFAQMKSDKVQLKRAYVKIMQALLFFVFPAMLGCIACSDNLIVVLYTEKWLPASIYLKLACVLGILYPFHYINIDILKVYGRSDLILRLEIVKKTLFVLSLFLTYKFGIEAILVGQIVVGIIALFINSFYSGLLISYSVFDQLKDVFLIFILSVLMMTSVYFIGLFLNFSVVWILIIQILFGVIFYVFFSYLLKISSLLFFIDTFKNKIRR